MSDYNNTGNHTDIGVDDNDSGVSYHFWTNGTALGYEIHFSDNRIEFIYLNPSDGSDDGVPTVFAYQGRDADPAADRPLCFFDVRPTEGGWRTLGAHTLAVAQQAHERLGLLIERRGDGASTDEELRAIRALVSTVISDLDEPAADNTDSVKLLRLSVQFRSGGHRGEDFPADQRDAVNERILEALNTGDTLTISGVPVPARDIQYWQWEDGPKHVVTGP